MLRFRVHADYAQRGMQTRDWRSIKSLAHLRPDVDVDYVRHMPTSLLGLNADESLPSGTLPPAAARRRTRAYQMRVFVVRRFVVMRTGMRHFYAVIARLYRRRQKRSDVFLSLDSCCVLECSQGSTQGVQRDLT